MCLQLEKSRSGAPRVAVPRAVPARAVRAAPVVEMRSSRVARPRRARPKRAAPAPSYSTKAEVSALVRRFEEATLPREEWTHAAHLVVALAFLRRHGASQGLARLRAAIERYNAATGTPSTRTRGYHETITSAWWHLVRHFHDLYDDGRSLPALADALVAHYASKDTLFEFFTRERLLSLEAKSGWVEPDVKPLPALEPFTRQDRSWLNALEASLENVSAARGHSRLRAKPVSSSRGTDEDGQAELRAPRHGGVPEPRASGAQVRQEGVLPPLR